MRTRISRNRLPPIAQRNPLRLKSHESTTASGLKENPSRASPKHTQPPPIPTDTAAASAPSSQSEDEDSDHSDYWAMDDDRLAARIARSSRQATDVVPPSSEDCGSVPISESSISHHSSALADPSTSVDSLSSPSGESLPTSFDVTCEQSSFSI